DVGVVERLLHEPKILRLLQQRGPERVAEAMGQALEYPGLYPPCGGDLLSVAAQERPAARLDQQVVVRLERRLAENVVDHLLGQAWVHVLRRGLGALAD